MRKLKLKRDCQMMTIVSDISKCIIKFLFFAGLIYLHGYKVKSGCTKKSKCAFEIKPSNEKDQHFWLMAMSDTDKKR